MVWCRTVVSEAILKFCLVVCRWSESSVATSVLGASFTTANSFRTQVTRYPAAGTYVCLANPWHDSPIIFTFAPELGPNYKFQSFLAVRIWGILRLNPYRSNRRAEESNVRDFMKNSAKFMREHTLYVRTVHIAVSTKRVNRSEITRHN